MKRIEKSNRTDFKSVDEYIRAQPQIAKPPLARVREAIRNAVPKADEGISYNMPVYKLDGVALLYFAAWKTHYALYPARAALADAFREELAAYRVNNSMIRFPFTAPVPVKLIAQIAKFRVVETADIEARKKRHAAGSQSRIKRINYSTSAGTMQ
jgi:uncharacterized protein YdhG (YjbR/CyaY superfamily)